MMLTIERCVKPPGIIYAARTYKLVLNDKGFYLLHLGRAMGPKVRADNAMADRIAQSMISKMEKKMDQKLSKRESDIDFQSLDSELEKSSKSRYFRNSSEVELNLKVMATGLGKLKLKGKGVKLRLDIQPEDLAIAEEILARFSLE